MRNLVKTGERRMNEILSAGCYQNNKFVPEKSLFEKRNQKGVEII